MLVLGKDLQLGEELLLEVEEDLEGSFEEAEVEDEEFDALGLLPVYSYKELDEGLAKELLNGVLVISQFLVHLSSAFQSQIFTHWQPHETQFLQNLTRYIQHILRVPLKGYAHELLVLENTMGIRVLCSQLFLLNERITY